MAEPAVDKVWIVAPPHHEPDTPRYPFCAGLYPHGPVASDCQAATHQSEVGGRDHFLARTGREKRETRFIQETLLNVTLPGDWRHK